MQGSKVIVDNFFHSFLRRRQQLHFGLSRLQKPAQPLTVLMSRRRITIRLFCLASREYYIFRMHFNPNLLVPQQNKLGDRGNW